jgi:hypothetical protein
VTAQAHAANQNKGSIYMVFEYMDHDLTGLAGALLLLVCAQRWTPPTR